MIPNHDDFIAAIQERKKVRVRFFSAPDQGVLDKVCLPLDYGVGVGGGGVADLNRYWLWCREMNPDARLLGLRSEQIVSLKILGDPFGPGEVETLGWAWAVPRDWSGEPLPFGGSDPQGTPRSAFASTLLFVLFASGRVRLADGSL